MCFSLKKRCTGFGIWGRLWISGRFPLPWEAIWKRGGKPFLQSPLWIIGRMECPEKTELQIAQKRIWNKEKDMREIVFKMERPGLVEVGQVVDVSESVTPVNVNYMIEPAVAMSGLFKFTERLKSRQGVVKNIEENSRGFYVTVEFDE